MKELTRILLIATIAAVILPTGICHAQDKKLTGYVHSYSPVEGYIVPEDEAVLKKLDAWQDLKFGVLFCIGGYSIPGVIESWVLCAEDEEWEYSERLKRGMTLQEFKQWYFDLGMQLNPVKFDPDQWADIMQDAGIKYMIFNTKHHDGFCLYDSKYTNYSITHGAYANNPRSNMAKEVFNAFRKKNFMIGCYFSKPDWHCEYYWNPLFDTPNRYHNYDREKHPDWWQKYTEFTMNQLNELTTDYGNIDILWLDGGQVRGSDVGLDEVLVGARQRNPGLICVDRVQRDKNENYQTPECNIPPTQRNIPWETCDPLYGWGWKPNPKYKSSAHVIAMITEVVAKGGNFLLGIGPTAEGEIDESAQERLADIGKWMRKYGKAIYGTRITPHYNDGQVWFNADKDGKTLYAIYAFNDEQETTLPTTIEWTENIPTGRMKLLSTGKKVKYTVDGNRVTVTLPKGMPKESFALQFMLKQNNK